MSEWTLADFADVMKMKMKMKKVVFWEPKDTQAYTSATLHDHINNLIGRTQLINIHPSLHATLRLQKKSSKRLLDFQSPHLGQLTAWVGWRSLLIVNGGLSEEVTGGPVKVNKSLLRKMRNLATGVSLSTCR